MPLTHNSIKLVNSWYTPVSSKTKEKLSLAVIVKLIKVSVHTNKDRRGGCLQVTSNTRRQLSALLHRTLLPSGDLCMHHIHFTLNLELSSFSRAYTGKHSCSCNNQITTVIFWHITPFKLSFCRGTRVKIVAPMTFFFHLFQKITLGITNTFFLQISVTALT